MIDQELKICFEDSDGHKLGIMSLKPERYNAKSYPTRTFEGDDTL